MSDLKALEDIRQAELEAFEEQWHDVPGDMQGQQRIYGAMIRAAIDAGWFDNGFDADELAKMRGGEVRQLGEQVSETYRQAIDIDPN